MQSPLACLRPCSLPICSCSIAIKPGVYSNAQSNRICWGISKFSNHRQAAVGQHQSRVHIRNPPTRSSMPAKSQLLQLVASNSWKVKSKVQLYNLLKVTKTNKVCLYHLSLSTLTAFFSSVQKVCQCASSTPQSNLRASTGVQNVARRCTVHRCKEVIKNAVEVHGLSASRAWIVEEFPGEHEEDAILIGQNHLVVSWIKPELQKMLAQSNKAILSTQTLAEMTLKPCNISQSKRYHLILPR